MSNSQYSFEVRNYVGTYSIKKINNTKYIISNEVYPRSNLDCPKLHDKLLFHDDFRNNHLIFNAFTSIDITRKDSIKEFCNNYGLPISSALATDAQDDSVFLTPDQFQNHDYMLLDEFCLLVSLTRHLSYIKSELDLNPSKQNPQIMFKELLSLILFSRISYDPVTLMNEQSTYITPTGYITLSLYPIVQRFLHDFSASSIEMGETIDFSSNTLFFNVLKHFSSKWYPPQEYMDLWIFTLKLVHTALRNGDNLSLDKYGNWTTIDDIEFSEEFSIDEMYNTAPIILGDIITERLGDIHVSIKHDFQKQALSSSWHLDKLFTGILFEFTLMVSNTILLRKCANENCPEFFIPIKSNQKFCCSNCRDATGKRRQRKRDKENPNRIKHAPCFQDRKK